MNNKKDTENENISGKTFDYLGFQKEIKGMNKYGMLSSFLITESEKNHKEETDLYYLGFNKETHTEYSIKQYQNLRLDEWLVENNDLVQEEQPIAKVKYLGRMYEIISPENGIIEIRFAPNTRGIPTQEDDIFFAIYSNKQIQIDGHLAEFKLESNTGYNDYFLPQYQFSEVKKWLVNDGDLVEKGSQILAIKKTFEKGGPIYSVEHLIFAPETGIIEILISNEWSRIDAENPVFSIYENNNIRLQNRYCNSFNIEVDEFTNSTRLFWTGVGIPDATRNQNYIYSRICNIGLDEQWIVLPHELGVIPENIDGKDYLRLIFRPKDTLIKKSDKILIRLETNEIISFELDIEPQVIEHSRKAFNIPILIKELELLSNYKVEAIRLQRNNDVDIDINCGRCWYSQKEDFQFVIIQLFKQYLSIVKDNIVNHRPLSIEERQMNKSVQLEEHCFVYLMDDTINNFYKIGISNSPYYREKTLQSEKPSIELIISKKFPNRKIAHAIEQSLHELYKEKRVRGEWFNLNSKDIQDVIDSLK